MFPYLLVSFRVRDGAPALRVVRVLQRVLGDELGGGGAPARGQRAQLAPRRQRHRHVLVVRAGARRPRAAPFTRAQVLLVTLQWTSWSLGGIQQLLRFVVVGGKDRDICICESVAERCSISWLKDSADARWFYGQMKLLLNSVKFLSVR